MSALAVAKKDFRDAAQSRALWALLAVFVLLSSLLSYAYAEFPAEVVGSGTDGASVGGLIFFTSGIVTLFVSLTAIVVCYKSIAGEREIGSIKLLLALPHSRRDVFLGKLLGRGAVLSAALAVGLLIGFGLGFGLIGDFDLVPVLVFLVLTLVFAVTFVGIVVSISATTGSTSRATTLSIGFFLLFELLWDAVATGIFYVANGFSFAGDAPDWYFLVTQIPPSSAYTASLITLLPETADAVGIGVGADQFDAFYATTSIGFVFLVFWLVVPLAVGYRRFNDADL
jgi:ABC-2 type transport system permease protein